MTDWSDMHLAAVLIFGIGLPIVGGIMVGYARNFLMNEIPKIDPELIKTRTDIYAMRAAYATFMVGLAILAVWACGIGVLGVTAGVQILLR